MTTTSAILIAIVVIRVTALLIAAMCLYLAYKLFFVCTEQQGHIEAGGYGVTVKARKVAPGVFFAIVAAAIIVFSLRSINYTHTNGIWSEQIAATAPPAKGKKQSAVTTRREESEAWCAAARVKEKMKP